MKKKLNGSHELISLTASCVRASSRLISSMAATLWLKNRCSLTADLAMTNTITSRTTSRILCIYLTSQIAKRLNSLCYSYTVWTFVKCVRSARNELNSWQQTTHLWTFKPDSSMHNTTVLSYWSFGWSFVHSVAWLFTYSIVGFRTTRQGRINHLGAIPT